MNHLSKTVTLGVAGVASVLLAVGVTPSAHALETTVKDKTSRESAFCTELPGAITKLDASMAKLTDKFTTARTDRDQKLTTDRAKWDQEIADSRTKWDAQRQEDFTKLRARAKTDTQKAAVETYITTVTDAIATRRTANDAARATFRTSVDNALAAQRSGVSGQVTTFQNSVKAAENTATASCDNTPGEGVAIRTAFQAALKNAREAYNGDRKGDSTIGSQVKQFAETRDAAIKANDAAFKATTEAARTALKAAFGNGSV